MSKEQLCCAVQYRTTSFIEKKQLLYIVPIINEQWSVSFQLQLALEASSGSQLTDAEEKLSDSLTAHTVQERDRKGEGIAKCSHVYPLSEDPLLPAHSLLSLALSSSTYTPTLSPLSLICRLLPAGVLNRCR